MTIVIKRLVELGDRVVETEHYRTTRLLLRADGLPATVTDITIKSGSDAVYGYPHHLEIAYCLSGEGRFEELETGATHNVGPGFLWGAGAGERFRFQALTDVRLICFFQPPLEGAEVNDETGGFPAPAI